MYFRRSRSMYACTRGKQVWMWDVDVLAMESWLARQWGVGAKEHPIRKEFPMGTGSHAVMLRQKPCKQGNGLNVTTTARKEVHGN